MTGSVRGVTRAEAQATGAVGVTVGGVGMTGEAVDVWLAEWCGCGLEWCVV